MDLETTLPFDTLLRSPNIADELPESDRTKIGMWAIQGYETDLESRKDWEARNADALKLALQVKERKSEPWDGCSNIKFPLVTIAAMHYHARAYPMLVDNNDLVTVRTFGADDDGKKADRAHRLGQHMTWQNMEQMPEWEDEHDKLLLVQPILGTVYKKRWFDPVHQRQSSMMVSPVDFVVNYYSKGDVNCYPRGTHVMEVTPNYVRERVLRGVYCARDGDEGKEVEDATADLFEYGQQAAPKSTALTDEKDERTGLHKPQTDDTAPVTLLEQLCWIDLDDDDYAEPYYVTVELETGYLRRIVARFNNKGVKYHGKDILNITPEHAYIRYGMIPAPDGSCMDIGFGHLLGPINDSVDTAINQLFDAGTMATLGGGFLGRGARLKGGRQSFKPFEWKEVDSIGDDLRKNIVALDVREPSRVLLELLMFLVQYGERLISANDTQVGENPGQNTPAETMRTMNNNGQRIYSAIFKRTWRAQRDEFRLQFDLNRTYLELDADYGQISGPGGMVTIQDYRMPSQMVCPAADPNVTSEEQRRQQAQSTMQLSMQVPGFNRYRSIRRYLEVMRVPAIDEVFPQPVDPQTGKPMPDIQSPPDPRMMLAEARQNMAQAKVQEVQMKMRTTIIGLQQQAQLIHGQITELQARAVMELSQAKGVDQGHQIALIDAMIGAKKNAQDGLMQLIGTLTQHVQAMSDTGQPTGAQGGTNQGGQQTGGVETPFPDTGIFTQIAGRTAVPVGGVGGG